MAVSANVMPVHATEPRKLDVVKRTGSGSLARNVAAQAGSCHGLGPASSISACSIDSANVTPTPPASKSMRSVRGGPGSAGWGSCSGSGSGSRCASIRPALSCTLCPSNGAANAAELSQNPLSSRCSVLSY